MLSSGFCVVERLPRRSSEKMWSRTSARSATQSASHSLAPPPKFQVWLRWLSKVVLPRPPIRYSVEA